MGVGSFSQLENEQKRSEHPYRQRSRPANHRRRANLLYRSPLARPGVAYRMRACLHAQLISSFFPAPESPPFSSLLALLLANNLRPHFVSSPVMSFSGKLWRGEKKRFLAQGKRKKLNSSHTMDENFRPASELAVCFAHL